MTDRDYFAAAALIRGMGVLGREQIAKTCYEVADVMLRERERHHIPDAGKMVETSGETDKYRRFSGEVMNWISEATRRYESAAARCGFGNDQEVMAAACQSCWDAFDRICYPTTNHDAAPAARAGSDEARTDKAATSHRRDGTGDTPSDAEIDALEFVVVNGRTASLSDYGILRQWLVRLRPECDSPEPIKEGESDRSQPIKEGESDRSQPIGSPAKTNPTQPRNGTPVEGSVPGEGSVPDSRSEKEPVAWWIKGVEYDTGCDFEYASLSEEGADSAEADGCTVTPLYRQPAEPCPYVTGKTTRYCTLTPFTLNPEEVELLREFRDETALYADENGLSSSEVRERQRLIDRLLERAGGGR